MSETVKRYDPEEKTDGVFRGQLANMEEAIDGSYVLYADHLAEIERLEAERDAKGVKMCIALGSTMLYVHELIKALDPVPMPKEARAALTKISVITTDQFCKDVDAEYQRLKLQGGN